jgi:integrase
MSSALSYDHFGGKLHLYKRENTPYWQCSTYLDRRNHRTTTKERDLDPAKKKAEEWYLSLQLKHRTGELRSGHRFQGAADKFLPEYEALTAGERNAKYVRGHGDRLRVHLNPYFGHMSVTDITPQTVQDYRVHRRTKPKAAEEREALELQKVKEAKEKGQTYKPKKAWTPPARTTLHHEIVTLRHVLKTAQRLGWIKFLPDLSPPYKSSGKISHRAWLTLPEYNDLCIATRERARNPPNPRWTWECEQLSNFVVFMVNTGLRPDEAARLQFRDVEIVKDKATNEIILEITVRGKRGTGFCKSMPGAVYPFEQLAKRKRAPNAERRMSKGGPLRGSDGQAAGNGPLAALVSPGPTDLIFPGLRHHHLNAVLEEQKLKFDREGLRRSAYSLRHTYICLRLMEGADIYAIAKNCRTSVEMIEKYYASHIKNMIDTTKTNVRSKDRPDGHLPQRSSKANGAGARRKSGYPKSRR